MALVPALLACTFIVLGVAPVPAMAAEETLSLSKAEQLAIRLREAEDLKVKIQRAEQKKLRAEVLKASELSAQVDSVTKAAGLGVTPIGASRWSEPSKGQTGKRGSICRQDLLDPTIDVSTLGVPERTRKRLEMEQQAVLGKGFKDKSPEAQRVRHPAPIRLFSTARSQHLTVCVRYLPALTTQRIKEAAQAAHLRTKQRGEDDRSGRWPRDQGAPTALKASLLPTGREL